MRKIHITKEAVGRFAKTGCKVVGYGLATVASYVSMKDIADVKNYFGKVNYSDAVRAIMNSSMYSSDKNRMIEVLRRDGNTEYYRTVISVVNSTMFSSDKIKTITTLYGEES